MEGWKERRGRGIPAADGEQQVSGWRGTSAHVVSVSLRCSLTVRGMDGMVGCSV